MKDMLKKATNPILYAGHGCTLYRDQFLQFIDRLNIPVMLYGGQSTCCLTITRCTRADRG